MVFYNCPTLTKRTLFALFQHLSSLTLNHRIYCYFTKINITFSLLAYWRPNLAIFFIYKFPILFKEHNLLTCIVDLTVNKMENGFCDLYLNSGCELMCVHFPLLTTDQFEDNPCCSHHVIRYNLTYVALSKGRHRLLPRNVMKNLAWYPDYQVDDVII